MRSAEGGFEVVLKGFAAPHADPAAALVRTFGIKPAIAQKLVAQLPAVIQRGSPRVRAEYFRRALLLIGGDVEVRDGNGRAVPPLSDDPSSASTGLRESSPGRGAEYADPYLEGLEPAPRADANQPAPVPNEAAATTATTADDPQNSNGWGRLLGLSTVERVPEQLDPARPPLRAPTSAFKPEPLRLSSRELSLDTGTSAPRLELAIDPSRARRRPPPKTNTSPALSSPAPRRSTPCPPPPEPQVPLFATGDHNPEREAHPGAHFINALISALALSGSGHGLVFGAWLGAGYAIWLVLGSAAWLLPGWLGLSGLLCTAGIAIALSAFTLEFFEHVFWARLKGRAALVTGPGARPIHARDTYWIRGLRLAPFSLLWTAPILWWVVQYNAGGSAPTLSIALLLLPLLAYAPLAHAVCASSRSSRGLWATKLITRAAVRAPVRYLWVCGAGFSSWLLFSGLFTGLRTLSGNPLLSSLIMGFAVALGVAHSAVLMADLLQDYPRLLWDEPA